MAFVKHDKKLERMINEKCHTLIDKLNSNILFGLKFEETVAKWLS